MAEEKKKKMLIPGVDIKKLKRDVQEYKSEVLKQMTEYEKALVKPIAEIEKKEVKETPKAEDIADTLENFWAEFPTSPMRQRRWVTRQEVKSTIALLKKVLEKGSDDEKMSAARHFEELNKLLQELDATYRSIGLYEHDAISFNKRLREMIEEINRQFEKFK